MSFPQVGLRAAVERAMMAAYGVERRSWPNGAGAWLERGAPDHPPQQVEFRGDRWLAKRVIGESWDALETAINN